MRRPIGTVILVVSILAAACGSGGDDSGASSSVSDPDVHIRVNMTEYGFGSDVIEVEAGQTVEFLLKNSGDLDHEFMIGREVTSGVGGTATGFEHDFFDGLAPTVDPPGAKMDMESMDADDHDHDHDGTMDMDSDDHDGTMDMDSDDHGDDHGFMVILKPGGTASVTVTIPDDAVGDWEIGCFRDKGSHWSSGMRATLRVMG
jgi:uncharacterized cupredoxin-like copper-binding protein